MREAKRRLSSDPVLHRIIDSLKAAGKKDKDLIEYLGMVRGTATAWKYRNIKSYLTHINDIAEFLNVSPNYLLRGIDDDVNLETLSEAEIRLINLYRSADNRGRHYILESAGYARNARSEKMFIN